MIDLQRIINSRQALTLASVPNGFAPLLLADLTRAAKTRALFIAPDESAMRAIADAQPAGGYRGTVSDISEEVEARVHDAINALNG